MTAVYRLLKQQRTRMLSAVTALALLFVPSVQAQTFPITIEHKYGTTVIEEKPTRVATIDYGGADNLLALGVQPVLIRHWSGDYPRSVWPWADAVLTDTPEIMKGAIDYEQIAKTEPDVIIGLWSGISQPDYEQLSQIAPVVAVPEGVGDYAMPWDERALVTGYAIGEEEKSKSMVKALKDRLSSIKDAHPEWEGKTASIGHYWNGNAGVYSALDVRAQIMNDLGFVTPEKINELTGEGKFTVPISEERLDLMDADLIIWVIADNREAIENLAGRTFLSAHKAGREIFLSELVTGAFSHASLLSLPFAIDELIPEVEAAFNE